MVTPHNDASICNWGFNNNKAKSTLTTEWLYPITPAVFVIETAFIKARKACT